MSAGDEAAQREIRADVLAGGHPGLTRDPVLNPLEGLHVDQTFVVALAQRDVVFAALDHPGIERFGQDFRDHAHAEPLWNVGLRLEETMHFHLRLEPSGRITFQRFLDDRCHRLVAHEHLARKALYDLMPVAHRSLKRPVAVHDAPDPAAAGLLGILDALFLCEQRLYTFLDADVMGLRELRCGGLHPATQIDHRIFQIQIRAQPPRNARHIVNDDDRRVLAVLAQERNQGLYARPVRHLSRQVILETGNDRIAAPARVFAAYRFL